MTAVVALEHDGIVWLGGDSSAVATDVMDLTAEPKVWISGQYGLGVAGSFAGFSALRHTLRLPRPPKRVEELDAFMACEFLASVRLCLRDYGCNQEEDGDYGTSLVAGVMGRVYELGSCSQVMRSSHGYSAIGQYGPCLGSLASTRGSPRLRVRQALMAAERHNPNVRAPFTVIHT